MPEKRKIRTVSEREIAIAVLLTMAHHDRNWFALLGFYDDDADFVADVAFTLGVHPDKPYYNKLLKTVRRLVNYGVLASRMRGTGKQYIGEPAKQMEYALKPGKLRLLQRGNTEHTMEPEDEAAFILRHAYPGAGMF